MVWTAVPEKSNHVTPADKRACDISALTTAYAPGDFITDFEEKYQRKPWNVHIIPQLRPRGLYENAFPSATNAMPCMNA